MEKTSFEFVEMDRDLPMKILHFSYENKLIQKEIAKTIGLETPSHFVPMHWHRQLEITYVGRGELILRKNNVTTEYQDGDFLLVNSGEIHELKGTFFPDVEIICFLISYDFLKQYLPQIDQMYFDLDTTKETYPELRQLFKSILKSYKNEEIFSKLNIQSDLLRLLYLLSTFHLTEKFQTRLDNSATNQMNQNILTFIHEHYAERISLDDIATHFSFSKEHFARLFKKQFNCTFLNYLTDYRLYRAFPDILSSKQSIEIISQKNGFPSSKALIQHFKRIYHETPAQYRNNQTIFIMDHNENLERINDGS